MDVQTIKDYLHKEPFEPFVVKTSDGETHIVTQPDLAVLMRSNLFIAEPNSDRFRFLALSHITQVQGEVAA